MAVVTGLTAARMLAIEAASVVDGEINSSTGHLILERHDGTTIDAGSALPALPTASTTASGIVELATAAEVATGTDATRAATPASLIDVIQKTISASSYTQSSLPSTYPVGESFLYLTPTDTTASWAAFSGKRILVRTVNNISSNSGDATQVAVRMTDTSLTSEMYFRGSRSDVWGTWEKLALNSDMTSQINAATTRLTALEAIQVTRLTASSYTQSSSYTTYPAGESLLPLSSSEATTYGWDFSGKAGTVRTFKDSNGAHQTWQRLPTSGNKAEFWVRAGNSGGWTTWNKMLDEKRLPDPQVSSTASSLIAVTNSGTWADVTELSTITLSLDKDAVVHWEFGVWLGAAADTGVDTSVRCGVSIDSADPSTVASGNWGQVPYAITHKNGGTIVGGGAQAFTSGTTKLTAGSHTFKAQKQRTGTGTCVVSYLSLRVTVIRWTES